MKNFPLLTSSGSSFQEHRRSSIKPTTVEGLVLDQETRWPMEGVKIAIFVCSEEGERVLVHEMVSDNNGYFSGTFQAAANTFVITPFKDKFNFSGSYSVLRDGERAFECELVKHGKNQFYTLTLDGREGAIMTVTETKPFSFKNSANSFIRRLVALPVLRALFS